MKTSFLYLSAIIFFLMVLVQCKKSVTQPELTDKNQEIGNPALIAPDIDSEQSSSVTLHWGNIEDVDSFQFQVSGEQDFSTTIIDRVSDSTKVNVQGLPNDTTLYWKVRGAVQGSEAPWSDVWHFRVMSESTDTASVSTKLESPEDGTGDRPTNTELKWQEVTGASKYKVQVAGSKKFTNPLINKTSETTSYQVSKLEHSKKYYWRIKPILPDENTVWSDVYMFSTVEKTAQTKPPRAPELLAPSNEASDVARKPDFKWEAVDEVDSYTLRVSRGSETVIKQQVEGTGFTPSEKLSADAAYSWQVRAARDGINGEWSDEFLFTTAKASSGPPPPPAPAAPELLAPGNETGGVDRKPGFEWKGIDGADSYTLEVSHGEIIVIQKKVAGTSFTPSEKLNAEAVHSWRVRAVNDGTAGEWSELYSFTTTEASIEPLPAPEKVAPDNGADDVVRKPDFKWKAVDGADSYTLHVRRGSQAVIERQMTGTGFTPSEQLSAEATHSWRVRAVKDGINGEWSKEYSFTTAKAAIEPLPAPSQLAPGDEANNVDQRPTFEWSAVSDADEYELNYKGVEEIVTDTTFTPTTNIPEGTSVQWRIRALDEGVAGDWSPNYSFTVESAPVVVTLDSPADGADNQSTSVLLSWNSVSGIAEYTAQMSTTSAFSSPVVDVTVGDTGYQTSGLANDQTYYWRVQAEGDGDTQNWSSVRSFTTEQEINTSGAGGSVASDRAALMDLHEATDGANWTNNSGWGSGNPSSSWYGIEVDGNGRVTRIDLWKNNLDGTLPASIGNLDKVKYLNVKYNRLTGTIPSEIGNMEALEWLILAGRTNSDANGSLYKEPPQGFNNQYHAGKGNSGTNNFSGTIPGSIGNLSNLERFELSHQSNIKGPIPSEIGNLSNLEGLYINFNDFSGTTLPSSIGNLTNLKHLYISSGQLEGEIPASYGNLTKLRILHLGENSSRTPSNNLTGDLPDFSNFTELRFIILDKNNLDGEYPHYWNNGNFTQMVALRMSWNNLTGTLHGFENLPILKTWSVVGNNLTGSIDPITTVPHNIKVISAGWNNFSGNFPEAGWPDFNALKTVYLNDNNITGTIPCSFWNKLDNPQLGLAWFGANNISDPCASGAEAMEGNGNINLNY